MKYRRSEGKIKMSGLTLSLANSMKEGSTGAPAAGVSG